MLQAPSSTLFPYTTLFRSDDFPFLDRARAAADPEGEATQTQEASAAGHGDRKSTRLNSSHQIISYAVICMKKKNKSTANETTTSAFMRVKDPPRAISHDQS